MERDVVAGEKHLDTFADEISDVRDYKSVDSKGYLLPETIYSDPYDEFSNLYFDGFDAIETKFDQEWSRIVRNFFVIP